MDIEQCMSGCILPVGSVLAVVVDSQIQFSVPVKKDITIANATADPRSAKCVPTFRLVKMQDLMHETLINLAAY